MKAHRGWRWTCGLAVGAAGALGGWGLAGAESLKVVEASVFWQASSDRVHFALELNRVPNWPQGLTEVLPSVPGEGTLSDGSRLPAAGLSSDFPVESFQFFLDTRTEDDGVGAFPWEVVVRGGEATELTGIPFRDAEVPSAPEDDTPQAGGWGPVLGVADYAMEGTTIRFSSPNAWVGVGSAGLTYELLVLEDGRVVDRFVPTPTALAGGLALLGFGVCRRKVRERGAG